MLYVGIFMKTEDYKVCASFNLMLYVVHIVCILYAGLPCIQVSTIYAF